MKNTPTSAIAFGSSSTEMIDSAEIINRLKAAEPTIVDGPNGDGVASMSFTVPMTLRRISGADDPRAIRVRFATVGFQNGTSM